MKPKWIIMWGAFCLVFLANQANAANAKDTPALKNQKEKMSYIIGLQFGKNLQQQAT